MNTLVYIGDSLLDLFDRSVISINFLVSDVRDLKTRFVSYTNDIDAPLTNNNNNLLGSPSLVHSGSDVPYMKTSCNVFFGGIQYFTGKISINGVSKGVVKISIFEQAIDIFQLIKGKLLSDLTLTETSWNADGIDDARLNTSNVVAPVMDWGKFDLATFPTGSPDIHHLTYLPCYFYAELVLQCLENTGYTFIGDILTSSDFTDLIIPYSNDTLEYSSKYEQERFFDATNSTEQTEALTTFDSGSFKIDVIDTITDQGPYEWYDAPNSKWVIPDYSSAGVIGEAILSVDYDISAVTVHFAAIYVAKNGVVVNSQIIKDADNAVYEPVGTMTTDATDFSDNDEFECYIEWDTVGTASPEITVHTIRFYGHVIRTAHRGMLFHKYLLPESEQIDLLQDFFVRFGAIILPTSTPDQFEVKTFQDILSDRSKYLDWTGKRVLMDESSPEGIEIKFAYESYAMQNYFKYTQADEVTDETLGRGSLEVENENLEDESDYFESDFENTNTVTKASIKMAQIPVYNEDSSLLPDFAESPGFRLLTLRDKESSEPSVIFDSTPRSDYRVAYFVDDTKPKDTGFQYFIDTYYKSFSEALRKPKMITRSYNITILDFQKVVNGQIVIYDSGALFMVNKIKNFIPDRIVTCELLRIY